MVRILAVLSLFLLLGLAFWQVMAPTPEVTPLSESAVQVEAAQTTPTAAQTAAVELQRSDLAPAVQPAAESEKVPSEQPNDGSVLLRIRVIDQDSSPVKSVKVGFRMNRSWVHDQSEAETGVDGWAEINIPAATVQEALLANCSAVLKGLLGYRAQQQIDLKNLPAEGIIFVLPPSGSLTVKILGSDGSPLLKRAQVSLLMQGLSRDPDAYHSITQGSTDSGEYVFRNLDFEQKFQVQVAQIRSHNTGIEILVGPTSESPQQFVTVQVKPKTEGAAYLVGRVLWEDGTIAANISFRGVVKTFHRLSSGVSMSYPTVRTDDDGRFRVVISPAVLESEETRHIVMTRQGDQGKTANEVSLGLSYSLPSGDTDAGDLTFAPPPLCASGVVLLVDGSPLQGARLQLEALESNGRQWNQISFLDAWVESEEDGSFEIRGHFPPAKYRVKAWHEHYSTLTQEIEIGAQGITLRMPASGALQWNLLVDEGVPKDSFKVRLEYRSAGTPGEEIPKSYATQVSAGGLADIHGLKLGVVDFILQCRDTSEELFRKNNVSVGLFDGVPNNIGEIDLRGQLKWYALLWRSEDGKMLERVDVFPLGQDTVNYSWRGSLLVVTKLTRTSFRVRPKGYMTKEVLNVSSNQTITFQKGFPVAVRISNPEAIPKDSRFFLILEGDDSTNHQYRSVQSNISDEPGEYEFMFTLEDFGTFRVNGNFAKGSWIPIQSEEKQPRLQVTHSSAGQVFSIWLDPEDVRATLEADQ